MDNKIKAGLTDKERQCIQQVQDLNAEFLNSGKGSKAVIEFLSNAHNNEALLLKYIRGRKYRPQHAWETLKRYAEVRFDTYPELFPDTVPKQVLHLRDRNVFGILKGRDSKGRRVAYFLATEWDPAIISMEHLLIAAVRFADKLLEDEDFINNGLVFIQQCTGMGFGHAKQYTVPSMVKFVNVFWYSYPVKLKGIYYANVPTLLTYLHGVIKPFIPKKFKERLLVSPASKKFDTIHELISPDILPKCLGGKLELEEALDTETVYV